MMIRNSNSDYNYMTTMCSHRSIFTNGFLKFLTRFSGRRRPSFGHTTQLIHGSTSDSSHYIYNCRINSIVPVLLFLVLSATFDITGACNSRTVPRPRTTTPLPQVSTTTTTQRPSITFPTSNCAPDYAQWYCLNGATCFTVTIGGEVLYNCECPDGYIGPRCDYKNLDGSYLGGRPRVMLETASIAGGAVAALFLSLVVVFFVYVRWHQEKKREHHNEDTARNYNGQSNGHYNVAADVVDGVLIECSCQQSQIGSSSQTNSSLEKNTNIMVQHTQEQLSALPHVHHNHPPFHHHMPPKRPFGPHHYYPISMSEVIERK